MRNFLFGALFLSSTSACEYVVVVPTCTGVDSSSNSSSETDFGGTDSSHTEGSTSVGPGSGDHTAAPGLLALAGDLRAKGLAWRSSYYLQCATRAHLVCVQYAAEVADAHDRFVFATERVAGHEVGGTPGAFALCQSEASAAGLPGAYIPFLGTAELVPAIWGEVGYGGAGVDGDLYGGGVYRLPGEPRVEVGTNLRGALLHPIDRYADGVSLPEGPAEVWTALTPELWLDVEPDIDMTELTLEEQRYYLLGRTCLDWSNSD